MEIPIDEIVVPPVLRWYYNTAQGGGKRKEGGVKNNAKCVVEVELISTLDIGPAVAQFN